ncbi:5-methyltetrahydropteroyltriglutamate--homocysteine S-methyltransferase [Alkalihalobacillus oceani]|uniref:5-methyltetrahydropteroyltriglutamate--homocysteine methyltransferase n=1 Tax=Halalkalibacter oceani TaxID=1653776 RepID=A0A9X2DN08_9BACI|nr:5-methyltetrahydropteroyltriglutamate--homocysteine S-methyltransferase [Halalkalibacter oceani]MCM3713669.1 5-methyltetrahydropteroyltriglutamate--homocysteine S-methyltransferase [Halalkalibacter oceani]
MKTSNLGYPRIGKSREWKRTLEAFWANTITKKEFHAQMKTRRLEHLQAQSEKGIDLVPTGDFSYYDHVLDTAAMFGLVPERFAYDGGPVPLSTYFAMARGEKGAQACEMTKWFDTNYHYIVPELEQCAPKLVDNKPLRDFLEAKRELGLHTKPVILGPFTFVTLAKGYQPEQFASLLQRFIPVYQQMLQELAAAGATIVQIDEPALVLDITKEEMALFTATYKEITQHVPELALILQSYFEAVTHYQELIALPVAGFGLDFVDGLEANLAAIQAYGFPADKILAAGVIDGRNIWRSDLEKSVDLLKQLSDIIPFERQMIQPSSSLLHVPVSVRQETELDPTIKASLAFCDEKLDELTLLKDVISGAASKEKLAAHQQSYDELIRSDWRKKQEPDAVRAKRTSSFQTRYELQQQKWQLPLLPTTTIGSFPQTKEIRNIRAQWRKNECSTADYQARIQAEIQKWIAIQEEIGLDVFVHGEFERNDMVEFFGEKLAGFTFSKNGWVQSYGSRCVKPPIIYGNVAYMGPMTVEETVYAQSLTSAPVKGMLTGPVTILNWSFVRNDIPKQEVAFQIAAALLQEVQALEQAGITMIQVDEPALREGLPLKKAKRNDYLHWAVEAFRRSTSAIADTTQIHTHMCYSDFADIIEAIDALDADVISIETSRSHAELISAFEHNVYDKGIGLGVYDIHSPQIPEVGEMLALIERALTVLPPSLFWVNPDCGLKTRTEAETVAALTNMVKAAKAARAKMLSTR